MTCEGRLPVAIHVARRQADAVNWADRHRAIMHRGNPLAAADAAALSPGRLALSRCDGRAPCLPVRSSLTWHRPSSGRDRRHVVARLGPRLKGRTMRVLVTGAAGFNGGSLIPELLAARALLGFTATTSPDEMIDEANAWIRAERATGDIDAGGRPRSPAGSSAR